MNMMQLPDYETFLDNAMRSIIDILVKKYWEPIDEFLTNNSEFVKTAPGFLVSPEKVILYFGKTHLGIEYVGPERVDSVPDELNINVQFFDLSESADDFLEKIIGFKYDDSTSKINMPIPLFSEGLIMPTNRGADKLSDLRWRFEAQDSMVCFNAGKPILLEKEFTRIVNGLFFDADEKGLRTRHIKWIDFVPIDYTDLDSERAAVHINLSPYKQLVEQDCQYVYPIPDDYDYQHSKLQRINRFLELVGNNDSTETQITGFLAQPENQFIISMRFGAVSIHPEVSCDWQSDEKRPIRPDFFVKNSNGFADIIEFKLPTATIDIVGSDNRETLSAKINTYVSQTRTYRNYFDDPNNRKWFEATYNFKVYRPRRYLVIGRRWQFDSDTWREIITDYQDLDIITYDDLIDGVVAQLYM
jgi:hypothetical protein